MSPRLPDPYCQTLSGRMVRLDAPAAADIDWGDIALQLARLPRFLGATARVVSVAEHSLLVEKIAVEMRGEAPGLRALALLHDAHEYLIGDWTTPSVRLLDRVARERLGFSRIREVFSFAKRGLDRPIFAAAGLPHPPGPEIEIPVELADRYALFAERAALMAAPAHPWADEPEPEDLPVIAAWAARVPRVEPDPETMARRWLGALHAATPSAPRLAIRAAIDRLNFRESAPSQIPETADG